MRPFFILSSGRPKFQIFGIVLIKKVKQCLRTKAKAIYAACVPDSAIFDNDSISLHH